MPLLNRSAGVLCVPQVVLVKTGRTYSLDLTEAANMLILD